MQSCHIWPQKTLRAYYCHPPVKDSRFLEKNWNAKFKKIIIYVVFVGTALHTFRGMMPQCTVNPWWWHSGRQDPLPLPPANSPPSKQKLMLYYLSYHSPLFLQCSKNLEDYSNSYQSYLHCLSILCSPCIYIIYIEVLRPIQYAFNIYVFFCQIFWVSHPSNQKYIYYIIYIYVKRMRKIFSLVTMFLMGLGKFLTCLLQIDTSLTSCFSSVMVLLLWLS